MKLLYKVLLAIALILISCHEPIPSITQFDDFPIWSPMGDYIAYISMKNDLETNGLYVIDTCGNTKLVLNGSLQNLNWFPSGNRILFKSVYIYSINIDSDSLTLSFDNNITTDPVLSPNGEQLLYNSDTNKIIISSLNGKFSKHIGYGLYPSWSSDNNHFIYVNKEVENSLNQIWISDTANIYQTLVTESNNPSDDYKYPKISLDGEKIIWMNNNNLEIINIDGTQKRTLITNGFYPSWSPNSKKITFSRFLDNEFGKAIFTINVDGTELRQIKP